MKEVYIHGLKVRYEEDAQYGIEYLQRDLDRAEARVFFDQAKRKKFASFEDGQDRDYTLSYNNDGSYSLSRRR